jgi:hypothetical protein
MGDHDKPDDKKQEKISENGHQPGRPIPPEDPGGQHGKK